MADPVLRVVLFPRPTAIWGTTPVSTEPFPAKDFAQAVVVASQGTGMGPGGSEAAVSVAIEQSGDMVNWFPIGSPLAPTAILEATGAFDLDLEWFRATATVSGSVPGVTMWAVAALVPRVPSDS